MPRTDPPLTPAQRKLVEDNLRLAYNVLSRYFRYLAPNRALYRDLAQSAVYGLALAASRHDPAELFPVRYRKKVLRNPDGTPVMRPVKFSTYAFTTVYGTILNALNREHGWGEYRKIAIRGDRLSAEDNLPLPPPDPNVYYGRRPPPRGLPFQFSFHKDGRYSQDDVPDAKSPSPADFAARADLAARVRDALRSLDPVDRQIVEMRYGLAGEEQKTLDEVCAHFGISRQRICQRLERATDRLSRRLGRVADEWFGEPVRKRSA